ncbi:TatD family hydrolase [Paraflavitalea speifideaquila]|uniref:TatD family hydrolase n=1 Tax=Paraflavitalea speifideaquila TaxID=3076558 RepID=UPI0028EB4328|nr:TatD family hydrolase [Paraflavitalea speifideiaquila]
MLALETRFPGQCIAMMGLHPVSVKENYQEELAIIAGWLGKRPFAAVGEIGLDYYWDRAFDQQQVAAFHQQIEWALQYKLPIVIHSRESMDDCIGIVREHQNGALNGIFHCFTGTAAQAQQIIDAGFYLGIGGVLTYKNLRCPGPSKIFRWRPWYWKPMRLTCRRCLSGVKGMKAAI